MKTFSHTRPIRNEAGEITGERLAPVSRVTKDALGHNFGSDKRKRLVVTLRAGDVIEMRPERTGRVYSLKAVDVYRYMIRSAANLVALEKARNKKAAKAARNAARRIKAAEARRDRESQTD